MENNFDFQQNIVAGKEQYRCSITADEFMRVYKITSKRQKLTNIIIVAVIVIVSLLLLPLEHIASATMLSIGLLHVVIFLVNFFKIRKDWLKRSLEIENKFQIIDIFDDKISISVIENNELTKKHSITYESILYLEDKDGYFVFADNIHVYYIKKEVLSENSILFEKFNNIKLKTRKSNKLISIGLVITLLSLFLVMIIPLLIDYAALILGNPCLWIYFTALPIPLASIIYSFILKKHRLKNLPALIVGIIVSVFLIINGLGQIGYNKFYGNGYNVIAETEEKLGIEIPTPDYIEFYKETYSEDNRIEIINEVYMEFIELEYVETDKNYVEKLVTYDVWMKGLPSKFKNIIPYPDYFKDSECSILYNVDTDEINTVPTENGTHRLVIIAYYFGSIDIIEYTITL